ncbi:hypothetical protein ACFOON_06070 [Novosphingobium piscinae]|uniref:Uncharacterized protein n=1 Tax=Novosphingobium piscinae TaxID=1507448 RepID=A0A7X1G176_9SPHN|nr:hypothetical protein [Novosphingobium piscinae]MBC2670788.1 hypothetical protein [Novosphingobium piscinae]
MAWRAALGDLVRPAALLAGSLVEAVALLAPPEAELGETADRPCDAWF